MDISNSFAKGWKPPEAKIILSSLSKAEISIKPEELTAPTTCLWNFLIFNVIIYKRIPQEEIPNGDRY